MSVYLHNYNMRTNPEEGNKPGICTPAQQVVTPLAQSETQKGAVVCDDLSVVARVKGAGGTAATHPHQKTLSQTCMP